MARAIKRAGDAETLGHGKQAGRAVVFQVLAGVEHIEAADPQRHRGAQDQHARIERAGDGDPCGRRRHSQAETQHQVRPRREALGVGIEKQNGQRDGRKFESQRIQLPCGEDQNSGRWRP